MTPIAPCLGLHPSSDKKSWGGEIHPLWAETLHDGAKMSATCGLQTV
jgi:hypothetical protein